LRSKQTSLTHPGEPREKSRFPTRSRHQSCSAPAQTSKSRPGCIAVAYSTDDLALLAAGVLHEEFARLPGRNQTGHSLSQPRLPLGVNASAAVQSLSPFGLNTTFITGSGCMPTTSCCGECRNSYKNVWSSAGTASRPPSG